MTFDDYCAANATLCGSFTQTAAGAPAAPNAGLFLMGVAGVGALSAGMISITTNDSGITRPLSP